MLYITIESPPVSDESFGRFLDLYSERCDYFSLSESRWLNLVGDMEKELSPFLYREIITNNWFRFETLPDDPIKRFLYPVNTDTVGILKKYGDNIFLHHRGPDYDLSKIDLLDIPPHRETWNQTLEDLCFFSGGKLILGTVSHEFLCDAFPPDEDFEARLFNIYAHWNKGDYYSLQTDISVYL